MRDQVAALTTGVIPTPIQKDGRRRPSLSNARLLDRLEQGVLLLNASLTVRANAANSHKKKVGTGTCHELM